MVFICGGLGIILHLAWLACLFFIMDGAFSACERYSTLTFASARDI